MSLSWRSKIRRAVLLLTLPAVFSLVSAWPSQADAAKTGRALLFDLGPLTKQQRLDDFTYISNIIEEQYAPLQLKEKLWNFKWEDLKAQYRERISREHMSHGEFGSLMRQFVAELHDAHTHLLLYREAILNGWNIRVSTLGFQVERRIRQGQSEYVVKQVMPRFFAAATPPVQVGDVIVAIDGRTPQEIIRDDLAPVSTTGREDSDASVLANDLTLRFSPLYAQRPTGKATLTIKRSFADERQVRLTWVDTDVQELRRAMRGQAGETDVLRGKDAIKNPLHATVTGRDAMGRYLVNVDKQGSFLRVLRGEQGLYPEFSGQYFAQPQVTLANALRPDAAAKAPLGAPEVVIEGIPFHILPTSTGTAAIYRVEDFMWSRLRCDGSNPDAFFQICNPLRGEDYATAFGTLARSFGIQDLVLDLRDNGGGALQFSDELLRAFGPQGIEATQASVRLNETWLGTFAYAANAASAPIALRSSYKQQESVLRHDMARGDRLSSPVYILGEATLAPNPLATQWPRLHVLINEKCASACDMFAAAVQDQKLGRILGRRSMGAGGNVVAGGDSPHEKFMVTQTASLAYRADGSFLENQGVTPDLVIDESEDQAVWLEVIKSMQPVDASGDEAMAEASGNDSSGEDASGDEAAFNDQP